MSDKSPRHTMTKKSAKSIKEKRADKRNGAAEGLIADKDQSAKKK